MDIKETIKEWIEKLRIKVHEWVDMFFVWLKKKVDEYFEKHPIE